MKLQVKNLSKTFKTSNSNKFEYVTAIENIDLTIKDGEFVSIVGPSGCGKSTLLNILAGLDKPTEGEIILNGHEIDGTGPDRIMVFQENALFPWLKVIENVEFGLKIAGLQKDKRRHIAFAHLETMQLTKFADSYVHQLICQGLPSGFVHAHFTYRSFVRLVSLLTDLSVFVQELCSAYFGTLFV